MGMREEKISRVLLLTAVLLNVCIPGAWKLLHVVPKC